MNNPFRTAPFPYKETQSNDPPPFPLLLCVSLLVEKVQKWCGMGYSFDSRKVIVYFMFIH
jgi:hypothetical protein